MSQYIRYPFLGLGTTSYASIGVFPAMAIDGALAVALDTDTLYVFDATSTSWKTISGGGGGSVSIGNLDGQTASVKGAVVAAGVLYMQSATASVPGLVNTGVQSFAGAKTFTGAIAASNLTGTNTGDVTLGTANGLSLASQALSLQLATGSQPGALSAADWTTFNGKQAAGSYITALTGDGAASGPGSAALTLATVNSNVGSFGSAANTLAFTVNAKGLVTAASSTPIAIAESQVTNLVSDLAGKVPTTRQVNGHALNADVTVIGADVPLDRIGASTYSTVQDLQNVFHSAGWTSGGAITDNGNGTIAIATGTGAIRTAASPTATIKFFDWAAVPSLALTDNADSYIYVNYNGGTPVIQASTVAPADTYVFVLLGLVYRSGTFLQINTTVKQTVADHAGLMSTFNKEIMPYAHASGAAVSGTGTRNVAVTAGIFWEGLTRFTTAAFDSSVAGTFVYERRNGSGGWTETATQTQINNTQYDDGTGTLATLTNNRYGVHWVYLETDSDVVILYGQGDYTLAQAQATQPPASLPPRLVAHGFLIARIIILKNATTFTQVDSVFTTSFSTSGIANHNDLAGLQGGIVGEYYHLTSAQATAASTAISSLTGDVSGTGPGATTATIGANVVTNAKAAQMATLTIKGNNTGATANAIDLTAVQVGSMLNNSSGRLLVPGYNTNSSAEANTTTGYATYADAAGAVPVDGTGGAPSVTFAASATAPLRGGFSFLFTKDAVNRQGQGVSYDFTIDAADIAKVLNINFNYQIASGTYVDGDMAVYIYDKDSGVIIQPAPYQIQNASGSQNFSASFQTNATSTNYRLIFHVASVSAIAYTVKLDSISVSPIYRTFGAPVTDWAAYTPVLTGFGTATSVQGWWQRVGSSLLLRAKFVAGAATGVTARIDLPPGLVIGDVQGAGANALTTAGRWVRDNTGGSTIKGGVMLAGTGRSYLTFAFDDSLAAISPLVEQLANNFATSQSMYIYDVVIPILGWSSSLQVSDQADTRVCAAKYFLAGGVTTSATQPINFATKAFDTHGAVTTSSTAWKFTAPLPGHYRVSETLASSGAANLLIYKNGVQDTSLNDTTNTSFTSGSALIYLNAGDYIDLRTLISVTLNGTTTCSVSIERLSGPSAIAASEDVSARYSSAAGQSIANGSSVIVNFDSKDYDTHGAVTTGAAWKFTAPIAGKYDVSAFVQFNNSTWTVAQGVYFDVWKNGVLFSRIDLFLIQTGTTFPACGGLDSIRLLAGEYIDFRLTHSEASARTLNNTPAVVHATIKRTGNY